MPLAEWGGWVNVGTISSSTTYTYTCNTINLDAWATTNSTTTQWRPIYSMNEAVNYSITVNDATAHAVGHASRSLASARRDARLNEERRVRDVARTAARDRADELLMSMLSAEQRESYRADGTFLVVGSARGLYRIRRGVSGNVDWIDPATGKVGARLCAHPEMAEEWLPVADVAVAQLLALTTDEPGFVAVANVHWGRRPPMPRRRSLAVA